MSNSAQWETGTVLRDYRLVTRMGDESWRAEDERNGRAVVIKRLNRSVPKDRARREGLLSSIRLRGAFSHPGIVRINEFFVSDEDELLLVTEWVDGETLDARLRRGVQPSRELFRWAWQLAEALEFLHQRELFHGALSPRVVLIDETGHARLTGFGLAMLTDRRERGDVTMEQQNAGWDLVALAHSSPEQLSGRAIDAQSDVFGLGTLLYEMSTGTPPFVGTTPAAVADSVIRTNPRNPKELNPAILTGVLQVVGRSLFKKREQRYANMQLLRDDLKKAEPALPGIATRPQLSKVAVTETVTTCLLIAEIPYAELLRQKDGARAARLEAKMQQILGEAVYLHDGQLIDSMGARMVASIPSSQQALEAARRAVAELTENNSAATSEDAIEPRMILHRGVIERAENNVSGEPYTFALTVLESIQPMQLLVSAAVLDDSGATPGAPLGTIGSVAFFDLPPGAEPEVAQEEPAPAEQITEALEPAAAVAEIEPLPPKRPSQRSVIPMVAAAVIALAVIGGLFAYVRRGASAPVVKSAAATPAKQYAADRMAVQIAGSGPENATQAKMIAAALTELLRQSGTVKVVDATDADAMKLTLSVLTETAPVTASVTSAARSSSGTGTTSITPRLSGRGEGTAVPGADAGNATREIFRWVAQKVALSGADRLISANSVAMNSFVEAAGRWSAGDAASKDEAAAAIRTALAADPGYLAANRLAYTIFAQGSRAEAVPVAEKIVALDPDDTAVWRQLSAWYAESGEPQRAIAAAAQVLRKSNSDTDALATIARFSLDAGDTKRFEKAVSRLETSGSPNPPMHRADFFSVAGDFDRAAKSYYDVEISQQQNAALAFKIGRIAALRESYEIAGIELAKLRKLDPEYGAPLLQAYINASQKKPEGIEALLATAQKNARWNDDVYTWSAEIYALLSEKTKVIATLEKAVERKEATSTFLLLKQPFFYIGYDARSNRLKGRIEANKAELVSALNGVIF